MKKWTSRLAVVLFFLFFLASGILIYKDYGIPWDEPPQIKVAEFNASYIFQHDPTLLVYRDRYYGVVFELPLFWLTNQLHIPRHLLLFLIFFGGLIAFYFLARKLFGNAWWGLTASVLLAASPRIFADSFYNSKDIPFLVITTTAVLTLLVLAERLRQNSGWGKLGLFGGLHVLASAAVIGTRIPGVMILPMTAFTLLAVLIARPITWKKTLVLFGGYVLLTAGLVVATWPILWNDPVGQFVNAFHAMSRLSSDIPMLFMGTFIRASKLPWDYLPVWIGITTPLIVLAGFPAGLGGWVLLLIEGVRGRMGGNNLRENLLHPNVVKWTVIVLWLAIPVAAIYYFHSIIYDGWRHMFFIYPAIVLISVLGLRTAYEWGKLLFRNPVLIRAAGLLLLLAGLAEPVSFMARYHPFENVYFNALAGSPATLRDRFELDYWGLSYKQAIDDILAKDPRDNIRITVADPPGTDYVTEGLPADQRARITLVKGGVPADYFVTEFRWHPKDYDYPEFYDIRVRGTKIMAVYKLR